MAMERTLSIVKPDAVARNLIGAILRKFEARRTENRRRQIDSAHAGAGPSLLCRAQSPAVFSGLVRLYVFGTDLRVGARRRERDRQESRSDGRDRPGESRCRDDSPGVRPGHRKERRAWFRRAGDRCHGNRFLLQTRRIVLGFRHIGWVDVKADEKPNIKDLSVSEFAEYLAAAKQPAYRAKQIWQWLFREHATDFAAMTNLPAELREQLESAFTIGRLAILRRHESQDGTVKFLFGLADGQEHRERLNSGKESLNPVYFDSGRLRLWLCLLRHRAFGF